ncbi:hypothetical protein [Microbulbifer sp. JMSA003]|uniref:hypothetical protein n=1 Tax=Microbulbifer sp. JMSA003 TaxID=3243369 RepID=UPI0040399DBA
MKLLLAFISAAASPALLMVIWYLYGQFQIFEADDPYIWVRTGNFAVICFFVSGAFVLLLGLPAYFLLRKFRLVRWWSTLVVGFSLAAIPMAIFTWPLKYPELKTSASVNGVQTMVDGVPTIAGWLQFTQGVLFLGVCGLVGALAFWLTAPNKFRQGTQ